MHTPIVTVLVPARDEEQDISRCVAAIGAQDYPPESLEIIVVDGDSLDRTVELATRALLDIPFARTKVLSNPEATTPSNLNLGLTIAQGEILCRVDARSHIPPHYVRTCVEVLTSRPDVSVVGGAQRAIAPRSGALGAGIARALNNKWAMGLSRYRRGARSGPTDTVYLGAFRTPQLRGARGWDEGLLTNQDFELNRRMARDGVVWFDDRLVVEYVPRPSLRTLFAQYHRFGRWKVRYWRATGDRPRARQLVLLAGGPTAGAVAGLAAWRSRRPGLLGLGLLGILVGLDAAGAGGRASLRTRMVAVQGTVVIAGGWLSGVWSELVRPRSRARQTG